MASYYDSASHGKKRERCSLELELMVSSPKRSRNVRVYLQKFPWITTFRIEFHLGTEDTCFKTVADYARATDEAAMRLKVCMSKNRARKLCNNLYSDIRLIIQRVRLLGSDHNRWNRIVEFLISRYLNIQLLATYGPETLNPPVEATYTILLLDLAFWYRPEGYSNAIIMSQIFEGQLDDMHVQYATPILQMVLNNEKIFASMSALMLIKNLVVFKNYYGVFRNDESRRHIRKRTIGKLRKVVLTELTDEVDKVKEYYPQFGTTPMSGMYNDISYLELSKKLKTNLESEVQLWVNSTKPGKILGVNGISPITGIEDNLNEMSQVNEETDVKCNTSTEIYVESELSVGDEASYFANVGVDKIEMLKNTDSICIEDGGEGTKDCKTIVNGSEKFRQDNTKINQHSGIKVEQNGMDEIIGQDTGNENDGIGEGGTVEFIFIVDQHETPNECSYTPLTVPVNVTDNSISIVLGNPELPNGEGANSTGQRNVDNDGGDLFIEYESRFHQQDYSDASGNEIDDASADEIEVSSIKQGRELYLLDHSHCEDGAFF